MKKFNIPIQVEAQCNCELLTEDYYDEEKTYVLDPNQPPKPPKREFDLNEIIAKAVDVSSKKTPYEYLKALSEVLAEEQAKWEAK